jgi:hypothetical protein
MHQPSTSVWLTNASSNTPSSHASRGSNFSEMSNLVLPLPLTLTLFGQLTLTPGNVVCGTCLTLYVRFLPLKSVTVTRSLSWVFVSGFRRPNDTPAGAA